MARVPMPRTSIGSMAVVLCTSVAAGPPAMELARSTIDGGGVMFSTGGDLELSGTIGQPDGGVLAGGDFRLTSGFWFELAPTDCNDDGSADLLDHASFIQCLAGPDGVAPKRCECNDVNNSGGVDLRDFATAQNTFAAI